MFLNIPFILKPKKKLLFLLFLSLISFSTSVDVQYIIYNDGFSNSFSAKQMKTFKISFPDIPPTYVHVTVTPLPVTLTPNQIVYFSNNDETCTKDRQLMSQKPKGPVDLFLTKQQLSEEKVYVCVECQGESGVCEFKLDLKSEEKAQLSIPGQYTYYVANENNKKMIFSFNKKTYLDPIASDELETDNFITIWAKGHQGLIKSELNIVSENFNEKFYKTNFEYGDIFTIYDDYEDDSEATYDITVEANVGELVTIGSNFIEKGFSDIQITPMQEEFFGYLKKGDHSAECYQLLKGEDGIEYEENESFYLYGISFSRILLSFWIDDVGEIIDYSEQYISDGVVSDIFFSSEFEGAKHFCIAIPEDGPYYVNEVVYTLKLSNHRHVNKYGGTNIYSPQLLGMIYPHYLIKGEVGVFSAMPPISDDAYAIRYNMFSIIGFPDMLFDICETFPKCYYDDEKMKNIMNPRHVNRMTSFTYYVDDYQSGKFDFTPISANQPLIIVNCTDGKGRNTDQSSRVGSNLCQFETSVFSNTDVLTLRESESYTQFINEGERDKYRVTYKGITNIKKIYLDLLIYTGDVKFEMDSKINVHKYFLANKIFYSITLEGSNIVNEEIIFHVYASLKSFYLIQFQFVRTDEEFSSITNTLESGINYLESVDPKTETKSKIIRIFNSKTANQFPFLVNFYSLNCKFKVTRETHDDEGAPVTVTVPVVENYGQEIIKAEDIDYYLETYEYKVEIIEEDISSYNKKFCMIYTSGLEIEETTTGLERTLSIEEGVPQMFIFEKGFTKMRYSYYVCDLDKNIIIYFNLLDKVNYEVVIYFGYKRIESFQVQRNMQWLLTKFEWGEICKAGQICSINIEITLDSQNKKVQEGLEPRLETTVRQIDGPPVYLQKNIVKLDMVPGNTTKYYYVDIGKEEMGDITVNYRRGSGKLYGKIVRKDQVDKEDGADWRDMYKFPQTKEDSLTYEGYLKKLVFGPEDTEDCENGCYLLLTIRSSVGGQAVGEYRFYPFSILVRVSPAQRTYEDVPKVTMSINEYVIGNIAISQHERMFEFYQVFIPFDADEVIIDWQSDRPSLFINVGDERPTTINAHFKFLSVGHDTLFKLSKSQILEEAEHSYINIPNKDSIKDIQLTLGLWTDQVDTLYTSVYAMKIHLAKKNEIDIYHVKSDQKVLCQPKLLEGKENEYQCLYALIFDGLDVISHLTVLPKSRDESAVFKIYADFIDSKKIEENDIEFLTENIPQPSTAEINSVKEGGLPYIFSEFGRYEKHLFINVISDKPDIIELLSSTYTYDEEMAPNPSTAQLFHLRNKPMKFEFATSENLLINMVSVEGKALIYWEMEPDQVFYLQGKDDRLTMTSGTKNYDLRYSKLVIQPNTFLPDENEEDTENQAGFVFYVTYYPRSSSYNIDQLKIGKSVEFNYRDADFPINFFVKLSDTKDISATLNFFNIMDSEGRSRFFNGGQMLSIYAMIINEEQAYKARMDESFIEKAGLRIKGVYNGAINVANIFLSQNLIESFGVPEEEGRVLFFWVEKSEEVKFIFKRISMEVTVLQENDENKEIPATEGVYQFGKLAKNEKFNSLQNSYRLMTDKRRPVMHIEFAANSDFIKWSVNKEKNNILNSTFVNAQSRYINGRTLYTIEIPQNKNFLNELYLNVFISKYIEVPPNLGNYVFKYSNQETRNEEIYFIVEDDTIKVKNFSHYDPDKGESWSNYTFTFNPVPNDENFNVSYFVRGVSKASYIPHEAIQTIALTESQGFTLQVNNPKKNPDGTISLLAYGILMNPHYLTVMAKINFGTYHSLVSYQPKIFVDPQEGHDGSLDLIEIDYLYDYESTEYLVKDAFPKQKYLLKFSGDIPDYIKVEVERELGSPSQVLYFSPSDEMGMNNRQQLAQEEGGKVIMWLKKIEFTGNNKKLYVAVECLNENGICKYKLKFTGQSFIEVESNFVHSYYANENNQQKVFHIKKNSEANYITIYGKGSKNINLSIKGINKEFYQFRFGSALTFTPPSSHSEDHYELTVNCKTGDYITIGAKVFNNGKSEGNILQVNSAEVFGYLKKNVLEDECYSISDLSKTYEELSKIYITGIFYNRFGHTYLRDKDYKEIKDSHMTVNDGTFFYEKEVKRDTYTWEKENFYICVSLLFGDETTTSTDQYILEDMPYTIQISDPVQLNSWMRSIYSPQGSGIIYPHFLSGGSFVYFSGAKSTEGAKKIYYNMRTLEGMPIMHIHKCNTFPVCKYTEESFISDTDLMVAHSVNRMTTWTTEESTFSPISPEQYVMVIRCFDENMCGFETSIFSDKDEVLLIEGKPYSQYILKNEQNSFTIDFDFENNLQKVHIDTFIISGDVSFTLRRKENGEEIDYNKYYLANKIFFSISLSKNPGLTKIYMDIQASKNSYYTIDYKLVRQSKDEIENKINSGINYLVSIDPTTKDKSKTIKVQNLKTNKGGPFLTNFYSLNCKFDIGREDKHESTTRKKISLYENYAQEVLTKEDIDYIGSQYEYKISITEEDNSNYKNNMCMLYISGLELPYENSYKRTEIIVSENVPQRVIFEKGFNKVRYLYPHSDPSIDIAINFNLIDLAQYKVQIIYESELFDTDQFVLGRSQIINIGNYKWEEACKNENICSIIVEVELNERTIEKEPMLEMSIRPIVNSCSYLPKNIVKKDFVINDKGLFLYTDIGKGESGEITVDFLRGSGSIFGKVAKKNQLFPDDNANWRSLFHIPTSEKETGLYYDPLVKKLQITQLNTEECETGCYLLLFISSSHTLSETFSFISYPFMIKSNIKTNEEIPIIVLPIDHFIVGNIAKTTGEKIYEFYQIWIPHDAEKVQFDWQTDVAGLYVSVGGERPTINNADFQFGSIGSDTIFQLKKGQILAACVKKGVEIPFENSIKNINLVIGIRTDRCDSVWTAMYTLKVHLPVYKVNQEKELDIFMVNSDQKNLCKPTDIGRGLYRCLYMIIYEEYDFLNNLIVYAESQDITGTTYMYANVINKNIYDNYDITKLDESIPTFEKSKYNSQKDNVDYLFLEKSEPNTHIFVSVVTDREAVIELMSSFFTYDTEISANPNSPKLFSVLKKELVLDFPGDQDILINLVSLTGEGEVFWENEPEMVYNLRGKDDRLSLALGKENLSKKNSGKLVVRTILRLLNEEENKNINKENSLRNTKEEGGESYVPDNTYETMSNPGFTFYVWYSVRPTTINFDEIYIGKTLEVGYGKTDFPIFLYSKIGDTSHDVNLILTMRKMQSTPLQTFYKSPFVLTGAVIKENSVYNTKENPEIRPSLAYSKIGIYDPALRSGQVYLTKEDLQKFKISVQDKPTLYFGMDKSKENEKILYEKFSFDITIIKENQGIPATEKIYQFGKLSKNGENCHKLKNNRKRNYLRVEFAANSKEIDFSIGNDPYQNKNSTFEEFSAEVYLGKVIVTFRTSNKKEYFYLTVFNKNGNENKINQKLTNYVFKYISADSVSLFMKYELSNKNIPKLIYSEKSNKDSSSFVDITVTFNKVIRAEENIYYALKVVPFESYVPEELYNTIAITESESVVVQSLNPEGNANNTVTMKVEKVPKEFSYIQVVAQVLDGTITEYIAYDAVFVKRIKEREDEKGKFPYWILIILGTILIGVCLALGVILLGCRSRNRDLMFKVQQVSFRQSVGDESGKDNLLLGREDNILE